MIKPSLDVMLNAEPEPLKIDLKKTALMVIDVQNAFLSESGYFTVRERDVSLAERIEDPVAKTKKVENMKRIIENARAIGVRVIYTASINPTDNRVGGDSSYRSKSGTLKTLRTHPELRDKVPVRDAWGAEIIDELKPQEGEILIEKPRFSAFFQTGLDTMLRTHGLRHLIFIGVATNICVEATLRDAYYREFFCILTSDATVNSGPALTQEATIFNVKACYGWVVNTQNILRVLNI